MMNFHRLAPRLLMEMEQQPSHDPGDCDGGDCAMCRRIYQDEAADRAFQTTLGE